jgi:hypothetical protein
MDEQYKQCVDYTAAECPSGIGPLCTGKGMGGHPGAFTDITIKMDDKCFTTCGKKLTDETEKEFDFYKSLYTEQNLPYHIQNLKKYMPDFYPNEVCEKKWEEKEKGFLWSSIKKKKGTYFPISNIKLGLGDNQKTLYFKIGKKTAFKSDKGAIGRFRHKILDEEMSRSSEIGFRLEGATEVNGMVEKAKQESEKSGWKDTLIQHEGKKQLQAGLYMLYPEFIWDYFIDNKEEGKKLLIQFKNFESDFIHPNIKAATEHQQSIGFIGSSVLIAKGSDDIKFNIIDFAHPFWDIIDKRTIPRKHKEIVLNYCVGLLSFISRYEQWYKTKFGEKEESQELSAPDPQIGSGRRRTRNKRRKRYRHTRKKRGGVRDIDTAFVNYFNETRHKNADLTVEQIQRSWYQILTNKNKQKQPYWRDWLYKKKDVETGGVAVSQKESTNTGGEASKTSQPQFSDVVVQQQEPWFGGKRTRKHRGGTKIKYNFDVHWQLLIEIQNKLLEKLGELPQGIKIDAIHELKHILLIKHIQEDLKKQDSNYGSILLESEKKFINSFDTTSEGCCTISGGKKRTRRRRKKRKKRRKKTRKKSGGCWRWPFSCGRKKDDDLTPQQKEFQQQAIENFFSSRDMIRPTNDKDAIKKIQEIQDRERKIQGQINAEKMRREYESDDSSDELLESWKDEAMTANKTDPREYYSGSTSPNPIARVTPTGYELYVEEPSGKKSPPPEWYKPMHKSPSLLELPKFKKD